MKGLRLGGSVVVAPDSEGLLAYDSRSGRLHQLNPLASLVVELCDGTRDEASMHDLLQPLVGDEGWSACSDWIEASLRSGLLEAVTDDAEAAARPSAEDLARSAHRLAEDGNLMAAFVCQYAAAELDPERPEAWFVLGELAHRVSRRDEAREAYERYLSLRPGDVEIEHLLAALKDAPPPRASDHYVETLFDRFAAHYDEDMQRVLQYKAPQLVYDALAPAAGNQTGLNVLDLGCGTGLSGEPIRAIAGTLTGVDLSPGMIEKARERHLYDVLRVAEITAFLASGEGAPYDVIVSCDTFIYFGDLRQVVAPSARLLKPGGVLAFSVERSDRYPFYLTDSGRYAHHREHVREVADAAGLALIGISEPVLRYEYGQPVRGLIVVLQRPA